MIFAFVWLRGPRRSITRISLSFSLHFLSGVHIVGAGQPTPTLSLSLALYLFLVIFPPTSLMLALNYADFNAYFGIVMDLLRALYLSLFCAPIDYRDCFCILILFKEKLRSLITCACLSKFSFDSYAGKEAREKLRHSYAASHL